MISYKLLNNHYTFLTIANVAQQVISVIKHANYLYNQVGKQAYDLSVGSGYRNLMDACNTRGLIFDKVNFRPETRVGVLLVFRFLFQKVPTFLYGIIISAPLI